MYSAFKDARVSNLQESNLHDLTEIYDTDVLTDHKDGLTYTFSEGALSLSDEFEAEICRMLNGKWSMGVLVRDDAEIGKDRRQVIRLAVILYVISIHTREGHYSGNMALFQGLLAKTIWSMPFTL